MRQVAAVLCGLVAAVALMVAVPAWWVSTHVVDADGFVDLASEAFVDDDVRATTSVLITEELRRAVQQQVAEYGIPSPLVPEVPDAGAQLVDDVLARDVAKETWAESARLTHAELFGATDEDGQDGRVVVDLTPVAQLLADTIGVDMEVQPVVRSWQSAAGSETVHRAEQAETIWPIAGMIALAAGAAAVLLARRQSTGLMWLGAAAVAVAGLTWVGVRLALLALDDVSSERLINAVVSAIADVGAASITATLLWVAAGGVVLAALGGVSRSVRRAGSARSAGP